MGERPHSRGNMLALGSAVGDEGDTVIMSAFYLGNLKLKKIIIQEQRVEMRNRQIERGKESTQIEKTSDFYQDRLSNQMGTIQEVGQSEWGGTLIG